MSSETFTYGLFNRPAMYGTVPAGFANEQEHEQFAYGTIDYDHRLTDEEIYRYEMARFSPNTFDIPIGAKVERLDACEGGYTVKAYYRGRYILTHESTGDEEYSMKVSDVKLEPVVRVKPKTKIQLLIEAIRAWQAANKTYLGEVAKSPDAVTPARQRAMYALDDASKFVSMDLHTDRALSNFVKLADEVERLQKRVNRLSKTADLDDGYIEFLEGKSNE